jgi:PKHD-type hydroxylase
MENLLLPEIDYNEPSEFNLKVSNHWLLKNDSNYNFYSLDNCFTEKECLEIIKVSKHFKIDQSRTGDGRPFSKTRKSKNCWLPICELNRWIYDRITEKVFYVNENFFNMELLSIELLQFTEYDETYQGFYKKHLDIFPTPNQPNNHRKLSFSVQLSHPCQYEGGELLILTGEEPIIGNKNIGSINFFPSYSLHEITPATKGTRYALVGWVGGPKFR